MTPHNPIPPYMLRYNQPEYTIASASTTTLFNKYSDNVSISGTTTITSFGDAPAGIRVHGRFSGVLTLTHNATSLILPGAANITTAANDRFMAVSLGSGNWIVVNYERASGKALVETVTTGVPAGTIIAFAGTSAPTGYLQCATTVTNVSRITYADLFAAIGTTWGSGDGSTTFGIPYFATGRTVISNTVGSSSTGTLKSHDHTLPRTTATGTSSSNILSGGTAQSGVWTTSTTGGSDNAAAGMGVMFCVKY